MAIDYERAVKFILMLSSSYDQEVLLSARKLVEMDIHEIAKAIQISNYQDHDELERLLEENARLKADLAKYTRICIVCGSTFLAQRSDAKTCSMKCRGELFRSNHLSEVPSSSNT